MSKTNTRRKVTELIRNYIKNRLIFYTPQYKSRKTELIHLHNRKVPLKF